MGLRREDQGLLGFNLVPASAEAGESGPGGAVGGAFGGGQDVGAGASPEDFQLAAGVDAGAGADVLAEAAGEADPSGPCAALIVVIEVAGFADEEKLERAVLVGAN